jgi:hypothetical protein
MALSSTTNRRPQLPRATQQTGVLGLTRAQGWGILFLVYTALFVLFFGYHYLDDLSRQRPGTFAVRFLEEFTGVYTVFLLLPLVLRVADFYLFKVKGWMRQVVFHLAAAAGFSFLHTSLMALSRWIVAPLMGLGSYDYGIMRFRFPMEFSNDLMGYTTSLNGCGLRRRSSLRRRNCRRDLPRRSWRICDCSYSRIFCLTL